jgi:hypothetical protein
VSTGEQLVFLLVIGGRFVLPLFIPKFPLPAIIACLVLDGVDQTIFQSMGYDPPGYQGYDKAMDVFYLAIAYLSTLRNWQHLGAFRISRFLYFYRLIGVVSFELSQIRALLLLFPNTFEYFFIAYEAVRTRWSNRRFSFRWWLWCAALIWVCVKLPQEWWIHVAQLDFTEFMADNAWAPPLLLALIVVAALVLWFVVRPRLSPPDWPWKIAADPLPEQMDTAEEQAAWHARWGTMRSWATVEKVVLVGLISVVYGQVLPGIDSSPVQLFFGVAVVVVVNAGFTVLMARRARTIQSLGWAFLARLAANVALVVAAELLLGAGRPGDVDGPTLLFFLGLISLITTLHDRWRPVLAVRVMEERADRASTPTD